MTFQPAHSTPGLAGLALTLAGLTACTTDSVVEPPPLMPVQADTARNVFADKPATAAQTQADVGALTDDETRTFYSLSRNRITDSLSQWDLALEGTAITVNGGARFVAGSFDSLLTAPADGYETTVGAWYNYSGAPNHLITPKDTILVIRTLDGNYAKLKILSYYKNNPESPNGLTDTSKYYTFTYFLQADGSTSLKAGTDAAPRTFFSLRSGAEVPDSTHQWDIAFRSTAITVNGAARLLTGVNFDGLAEVPVDGYTATNVPTWYDYDMSNHTITPKTGTVIALKTVDGAYAKLQILSYYENAPDVPVGTQDKARHYTFRWVLQSDGTPTFP